MGKATAAFQRSAAIEDTTIGWRFVNPLIKAQYGVESMPETAENVVEACRVSRADQAVSRCAASGAAAAAASGFLADEIVAATARDASGKPFAVERDEHPRPNTTAEGLARLGTPFRDGGSVTAGNASGINDGATALFVASARAAEANGLTPRARVLGMATAGVEPRVMGLGPVPASRKLMARLGLTMRDVDIIEINEAFAAQVIACLRELGVDPMEDRVNPHGGAITLGHPLGTSGTRIAMTAVHALEKTGGRRALVTLCVGVGQRVAMALERV